MKTIAIVNNKGGVGKSTTALALGAGYKARGAKVLYIDLDMQGNLSSTLQVNKDKLSVYELLAQKVTAKDVIQTTPQGDVIPSAPELMRADETLTKAGREYRLKEGLASSRGDYDKVVIDTPPALGVLLMNALAAADDVLIPAQADTYSVQGIAQLGETIEAVQKYCNPALKIAGVLLTRFNGRAIISRELAEVLDKQAKQLGTRLLNTKIRECVALKEAQALCQSIFDYAPDSNAAADYKQLLEELGE